MYSSAYPNMEVIPLMTDGFPKDNAVRDITEYVLKKIFEYELTVHEVKYLLNRIADCVMDNAVYKPISIDDDKNT